MFTFDLSYDSLTAQVWLSVGGCLDIFECWKIPRWVEKLSLLIFCLVSILIRYERLLIFFQKCRTFTKRLSVENIEDLMTTECVQYVIIQATDNYFGFDLLDEEEQAYIFALIYTKATDFVNGWMVSKVMPQWVRSYSDWLAFEK